MALSSEQVRERLKKPLNREILNIAIRHEDRVKFCVKKCLEHNRPNYTHEHIERMRGLLPAPKFNRYINELMFPLPIMETADVVFSGLFKIFDGQNKAIYPTLSDIDLQNEFSEYLSEINFNQFWESTAWEAFRSMHNCLITIDLPATQETARPQPYISLVDIASVKDITTDKEGWVLDLMYVNGAKELVVIDELNYQVYAKTDDGFALEPYIIGLHGLDYCPAKFLIDDALDSNQPIVKESPASKVLYGFEKLLFRIISGENLEDYAAYPIAVMAEQECNYQDQDGNQCHSGYINRTNELGAYQIPCPICSSNHLVGAGSAYQARKNQNDQFDLDNVIKFVSVDIDNLNYKDTSISQRSQSIIASCIGQDQSAMTGQAKNEKQIASQFENSQTILMRIKRNFERSIKFCMDAMGTIMFESAYLGSTVNLGSRFFLATPEQLQARLDGAIASGAPEYELGIIRDEMNSTEYQNDPRMLERLKILKRLEPFPNRTITDVETLAAQNKISNQDLYLKYNFTIFISEFEDENGDIVDFGTLLSFSEKIKRIKAKLDQYVTDQFKTSIGIQTSQTV